MEKQPLVVGISPQPLLEELRQHTLLLTKLVGMMAEAQSVNQDELLSVRQVAKKLNKSSVTIRRWIAENRIDAVQVRGSRYMIPKSVIEKIMTNGSPAPFPIRCELRSTKGG